MGSDSSLTDDDSELIVKGVVQSPSVAGRRLRPQLREGQNQQRRMHSDDSGEIRGGVGSSSPGAHLANAARVFCFVLLPYTNRRKSCFSSALNECSARNSQTTTSALALNLE